MASFVRIPGFGPGASGADGYVLSTQALPNQAGGLNAGVLPGSTGSTTTTAARSFCNTPTNTDAPPEGGCRAPSPGDGGGAATPSLCC